MNKQVARIMSVVVGLSLSVPAYATSVTLQPTSPGTAETGSINVTGTIIGDVLQGSTLNVSGDASIGGALAVNTIDPTGALTVGDTTNNLVLQGSSVSIKSNAGGVTNTLAFATPSGSNKTVTLPNASGTICLDSNNCGFQPSGSYVNLNPSWPAPAQFGYIGIGNGEIFAGASHITRQGDFGGTLSTSTGVLAPFVRNINTGSTFTLGETSSPIKLMGSSLEMDVNGSQGNTRLIFNPPTSWNNIITMPNAGGTLCVSNFCDGYSHWSLDNLTNVAINTSLLPASSGSANLGSSVKPFGSLYLTSALQAGGSISSSGNLSVSGNSTLTGSLSIGGGTPITKHISATSSQGAQSLSTAPGCNSFTVTATGAAMGDTAVAAVDQNMPGTWTLSANVSAADTVTVKACAFDTSTTIAAGTYRVDVWKH